MTAPSVREALEFYANPDNWTDTPSWDGDPDNTTPKAIPIIRNEEGHPCDCGDTARKTLAALDAPKNTASVTRFEFDRYINGKLMAEGVTIERQANLAEAMCAAARIASKGPNGETPALVLRATPPTPSAARERIARIIDPDAFTQLELEREWCRQNGKDVAQWGKGFMEGTDAALAKADAILALLPDAAAIRADASYLDFFEKNTDMELSCSWEDDDGPWEVHSVTGGRSDREWRKVGQGRTPREAIAAAIRAAGEK